MLTLLSPIPDPSGMGRSEPSAPPPRDVLSAFGGDVEPSLMAGGQGQTYRSGGIVLKPVSDGLGTAWISEIMSTIREDGFRIALPVPTATGEWVYGGWAAWQFVEGTIEKGRWQEEIETCIRFHRALRDCRPPKLDPTDAWVIADAVCWGDRSIDFHPQIVDQVHRLQSLLRPIDADSQLIHGDFGGSNLLYHEELPPAVLDMSPYWRPAGFAVGVIVADAIVWEGADTSICVHAQDVADFPQLLARAELRRIVELQTIEAALGWPMLKEIDAHIPLVDHICGLLA